MKKIRRIAYAEPFRVYIYVSYKYAEKLENALIKGGWDYKNKDVGDQHEISVLVTPIIVHKVIKLFNKYA